MSHAVSDEALDTIFRAARTHRHWQDKPVGTAILMAVYDLMRFCPTAGNISPARIVFVVSQDAKARLKPHLDEFNVEKTMTAPATAILATDLDFPRYLSKLNPRLNPNEFDDADTRQVTAFRSATLQGGYFILAARALGLDCGPMSGFNNEGVDREFFAGTNIKSNFLCNLGYGDPARLRPRAPRLDFDEACTIA